MAGGTIVVDLDRFMALEAVVEALQDTDIMEWRYPATEPQDMTAQLRRRKWERVQDALARLGAVKGRL